MAKIFLSCHVEPDKSNDDISYLVNFLSDLKKLNKPVLLLLMYGEGVRDEILQFFKRNQQLIPANCAIGLHVHGAATKQALESYKKHFGRYPQAISFGHWDYADSDLLTARKHGVMNDYSYAAYRHNQRYFFKKPFRNGNMWQYPVSCDPKYPVNPFLYWYNLFLFTMFVLIKRFFPKTYVHVSFHSYDWLAKSPAAKLQRALASRLLAI